MGQNDPLKDWTIRLWGQKTLSENNFKVLPWLMQSLTCLIHTNYACTHTKTYKPDFSERSCGPSLTPESALSRLVAVGSLFPCQSLSLSVWAASNSMCGSYPFSTCHYHCQGLVYGPPGAIRKIYPFILQDTHLAKQRPSGGTCQEGYTSMWQPFACLIFCSTGILVS